MSRQVDIEGVGVVDVPEDASPDEVLAFAQQASAPAAPTPINPEWIVGASGDPRIPSYMQAGDTGLMPVAEAQANPGVVADRPGPQFPGPDGGKAITTFGQDVKQLATLPYDALMYGGEWAAAAANDATAFIEERARQMEIKAADNGADIMPRPMPDYGGNLRAMANFEDTTPAGQSIAGNARYSPKLAATANIAQTLPGLAAALVLNPEGAAGRLIALGFSADMVLNFKSLADEYATAINMPEAERDPGKIAQLEAGLWTSGLMAPLAGAHGAGKGLGAAELKPGRFNPELHPIQALRAAFRGVKPAAKAPAAAYARSPMDWTPAETLPPDSPASGAPETGAGGAEVVPPTPNVPQFIGEGPAPEGMVKVTDETVFNEALARQQALQAELLAKQNPAPAPPAPDQQAELVGVPVKQVPRAAIATRADLMQFKRMDDSESGVNQADKLAGSWDALKAGNLLLWEPKNPADYGLAEGQKYIVANGHHRFEFGQGQDVKAFNAQVVREADGYSAGDARRLAAEINIADGKGTIYDQAKFIRNTAATHGPDEAVAAARRIGARGRQATDIALAASDPLWDSFVNEQIPPDTARAIANAAPNDVAAQSIGIKAAAQGKPADFIANLIKASRAEAGQRAQSLDLFGNDDSAMQKMAAQAARASGFQREIRQRLQVLNAGKRNEIAASEGIDVKNPAAIPARIAALKEELHRWDNWPLQPDLVAKVKGQKAEDFNLAAPESVEQQRRRMEQEAAAAKAKVDADALAQGANQPLVGSVGDIGQGDLLGGGDMFSASEVKPPAPPEGGTPNGADINSGALGESGLGGAKPGEFAQSAGTAVGVKVAAIDAQRAARGEEPLTATARRSFPDEVWQGTLAKVDNEPEAPARLVQELTEKPRPLADRDVAMLLYRQADLSYQRARLTRDMAQAYEDSHQFPDRLAALDGMKLDAAGVADELDKLDRAVRPSSSETGRGLAALRHMVGDNYTLEALEFGRRAAKGGEPLNDAERAELVKLRDEIATAREAQASAADKEAMERAQRMADDTIAQLKVDLDKRPNFDSRIFRIAEEIVTKLEKKAEASDKALKEIFGRASAGVDPTILYHLGVKGAALIARGGLDFAEFSVRMLDSYGDKVRDYLPAAWEKANLVLDNEGAKYGDKSDQVKNLLRKRDAKSRETNIVEGLKQAVKDGAPLELQGDYIRRLMENLIRHGVTEREPLIDAIHKVLTDEVGMKDVTRRDVMEAMSGYGQFKALNPDPIKVQARDIRGQIQQVLKLQDIVARQPLPKTGVERRTPSTAERLLTQQVNEAKRRYGVVVTDPAAQLKSALDARKTWLKNQISDLEYQIVNKERTVKTKTAVQLDNEGELLKLKREELKRQLDEIAPRPELTDQQRAAIALRSVNHEIELATERIKGGEVLIRQGKPGITTPELTAARARLEALRAEEKELREASDEWQRQNAEKQVARQAASLTESIALKEKQLAAGPQPPEPRPVNRPADPRLEALMQQRDTLNRQLAEARKKPAAQKYAEQLARQLETMQEQIAERQAKIASGDYSVEARAQAVNRPLSPELEVAKQQLELLNRQLAELRNPKKTPEERAVSAALTRMSRQYADLLGRSAREEFTPRPRREQAWKTDPRVMEARAAVGRAQQIYEDGNQRARLARRTGFQRFQDASVRWSRNMKLLSWHIYPKLLLATATRVVTDPVGRVLGQPLRVIPGFAEKAPVELGLNLRAEAKAIGAMLSAGPEAWRKLRTGASNIDALGGKQARDVEMMSIIGNSHGMFKEPLRQAGFAHSLEVGAQHQLAHGLDPADPVNATANISNAVADANRRIFMNDNVVSSVFHRQIIGRLNGLAEKDVVGMRTLARTLEFLMPIVRVSSNIGIYQTQLAVGLPEAFGRLALAAKRGELAGRAARLKPEDAAAISRAFKLGLGGLILAAYAWNNPDKFGGEWDEKGRKKTDRKAGEIATPFGTLPHWANHTPEGMFLNVVASARRMHDRYVEKHPDHKVAAAMDALAFTAITPVKHLPFIDTWLRLFNENRNPGQVVGALVRDAALPNIMTQTLKEHDPVRRSPVTGWQEFEMGVPGLRQNVPEKPLKSALGALMMKSVRGPMSPEQRAALRQSLEQRLKPGLADTNGLGRAESALRQ